MTEQTSEGLIQAMEVSRNRVRTDLEERMIAAMSDKRTLPTYADMARAAIVAAKLFIESGGSWKSSPPERWS